MLKTTFILVTVLFAVICGNRLMDNRLRSSTSSVYAAPYKYISDVGMNSFNGKMERDSKLKTLENLSKPVGLPCGNAVDFDQELTARHCNDNIVNLLNKPTNYLTYDNSDDDSMHNINDFKSYPNAAEFDEVFEAEPVLQEKNSNMKMLQPKLNIFPVANYKEFYDDLVVETVKEEMSKRNGNSLMSALGPSPPRGCDCKIRNDLVDLGQQHFPRYLLNAICHSEHSRNDLGPKCWSGSGCRPLEYKVKVLTFRTQKDPTLAWLPDDLRQIWKFKTITVTAGCFCA